MTRVTLRITIALFMLCCFHAVNAQDVSNTKSGVKVSPSFGTCSDLIKVKHNGDSISVSMPGYRGPFESKRAQNRAARERHVFIYHAGVLTENGKPVK